MSYKNQIVKNPSAKEEKDKYRKGYIKRQSLNFIKLERHPLSLILKKVSLATHHIISIDATTSLNKVRGDLLKLKAYNVNHPKNLVTLPTSKDVCCQYALPRHASAHTGKNIIPDYKYDIENEVKNLKQLHDTETDELSKNEASFKIDTEKLDTLKAYHKICRVKLTNQIKFNKLNCKSKPEKVVNTIDALSATLLLDISLFNLNLFNNGKYYKKERAGCSHSTKKKCSRNHELPNAELDDIFTEDKACLKRVYDMRSEFNIDCNAPAEYEE